MKNTGILTALLGASALVVACSGDMRDRNESSQDTYINEDSAVGTSGDADDDRRYAGAREFAHEAAIHGNAEVQLGELAARKGQSAQVKQFGQMMVTDHTKASNELKQALAGTNILLPTGTDEKHQELFRELSEKSGADFDRAYMDAMVEGHEDVKDLLEGRARNRSADIGSRSTGTTDTATRHPGANQPAGGNPNAATGTTGTANGSGTLKADAALTQWANKTLPSVEEHLTKAKQVRDALQ